MLDIGGRSRFHIGQGGFLGDQPGLHVGPFLFQGFDALVKISQGLADIGQALLFLTALPAGLFRSLAGFAPMVFGLGQFPGRFFGLPAQFPALSGQGFQTLLATAAGLLQFLQQRPPADEGTFLIAGAAAGQGAAGVELRPVEADDAQAMAVFPGHSRARIHGIGQEGPP